MAPSLERSTTLKLFVDGAGGGTSGFQPRIVPLSVAKRNTDGSEAPLWLTTNPDVPLKTVPVGAPLTLTISGSGWPEPSYSVDVSVPLFATHHGVVGPDTRPHAFFRLGSVVAATPGLSETSLVILYESSLALAGELVAAAVLAASNSATTPDVHTDPFSMMAL